MIILEVLFWICAAAIVWTQVGYALVLVVLARLVAPAPKASGDRDVRAGIPPYPKVSLIIAAHDEQEVIASKVQNALELDYPRDLLEVIVVCDGCADETALLAREAGADVVLELPRGGKIVAQDAAVERARGEIVAFSDANAWWEPDALRRLVGGFADSRVGYACGRVRFVQGPDVQEPGMRGQQRPGVQGVHTGSPAPAVSHATNQEGIYWRYEMAVRACESRLSSITAGNGAIYATRRGSYIVVDPIMGHDLSFPFNMVKRGWRAIEVPEAQAVEKMVPTIEGEWRRKRRMMSHTWPILIRGGMLSPRGYTFGYAAMILSHRLLRYLTPFLHAIAFFVNIALVAGEASRLYTVTLCLQVAIFASAGLGGLVPVRPFLITRYYFFTTLSAAAGLWDWLRHGTAPSWESAEGTR
jgi:cellulose synthase/poly-beta-1,6-N-acetylglucosamine synthase-like glycosyltransferase